MRNVWKLRSLAAVVSAAMVLTAMPTAVFASEIDSAGETEPAAVQTTLEGSQDPTSVGNAAIETAAETEEIVSPEAYVSAADSGIAAQSVETESYQASIDGQGYETLAAALAAATAGDTVTLEDNVSGAIDISKSVTLDLNGYTIDATSANYAVFATANVTIQGNGEIKGGNYGIVASGTSVTLTGGTVSAGVAAHVQRGGSFIASGGALTGSSYAIYVGSGNSATVEGSSVLTGSNYGIVNYGSVTVKGGSISAGTYYGILNQTGAIVTMTGGQVTGNSMGIANLGTVDMSGGTAGNATTPYGLFVQAGSAEVSESATVTGSVCGMNIVQGGQVTVSGGKVTTTAGYAVEIDGNTTSSAEADKMESTLTITGGQLIATEGELPCGVVIMGNGATLNMSGGSINAAAYAISGNGMASNAGTKINISNGRIESTGSTACAIYHPQAGTLNISGTPTIKGATGIQLCSGTGVSGMIEGGSVTANGEDLAADKTGGDGVIPDGAALSIIDRSYPGDTPHLTVTGGTFISEQAQAVSAYTWENSQRKDWADAGTYVSLEGGWYTNAKTLGAPKFMANGYGVVKESETADTATYLIGEQKILSLAKNIDNASVSYHVMANTADAVSEELTVNPNGTYTIVTGSVVYLTAEAGTYNIESWNAVNADNSTTAKAISKSEACMFMMMENTSITVNLAADTVEESAVVDITAPYSSVANGTLYFNLAVAENIPADYTVIESGIAYGTNPDNLSARYSEAGRGNYSILRKAFTIKTTSRNTYYFKGYVLLRDTNGIETTVYSNDTIVVSSGAIARNNGSANEIIANSTLYQTANMILLN